MKKSMHFSLAVGILVLLTTPVSAQMMTKSAAQPSAGATHAMMTKCSAMMKEFMADPIVQQRMMAIMQKHMKHTGGASMMMPGTSDSSSHEAHHPAVPMATSASSPMAVPSP